MEYPTIEDMIKHYGVSSILEEINASEAIDHYGIATVLEEMTLADVISHYDRDDLVETLGIDHMDHVTSEDCYNTYGTDLLTHFGDGELWDAIDERWRFVEDYVSNNYSASDIVDTYGDSTYLFEHLVENEVSNDTIAAILMKYSEYKEILGFLDLAKADRKALLQDMLRAQRSINTEEVCDGSGC